MASTALILQRLQANHSLRDGREEKGLLPALFPGRDVHLRSSQGASDDPKFISPVAAQDHLLADDVVVPGHGNRLDFVAELYRPFQDEYRKVVVQPVIV